jgi:hypothetical protein
MFTVYSYLYRYIEVKKRFETRGKGAPPPAPYNKQLPYTNLQHNTLHLRWSFRIFRIFHLEAYVYIFDIYGSYIEARVT